MLLSVPIIANIQSICTHRQLLTEVAGIVESNYRQFREYHIGDQKQIMISGPDALQERMGPPFTIVNIHTNSTISYLKNPNTIAQINICRIQNYI